MARIYGGTYSKVAFILNSDCATTRKNNGEEALFIWIQTTQNRTQSETDFGMPHTKCQDF